MEVLAITSGMEMSQAVEAIPFLWNVARRDNDNSEILLGKQDLQTMILLGKQDLQTVILLGKQDLLDSV